MANPIQLTMVSAVPLTSPGEFFATRVENKGESAVIVIPQKRRIIKNSIGFKKKIKGEIMQHMQDARSANVATGFGPNFIDSRPPRMQPKPPIPIIRNAQKGILIIMLGWMDM